jgi:uncharacterized repeat protein (TIGR03803 family)
MSTSNWWMRACVLFLLWAATAVALPAQTFKTLKSFDGTDGAYPYAGLVQGANGDLYGTTYDGGTDNYGTVFEITPTGTLMTLLSFDTGGRYPYAGRLVQATNGNFYGTTYQGLAGDVHGTVFEITPEGKPTTLHSFAGYPSDGAYPYAGLVQGTNGNFYGTTGEGGTYNDGTVFEITPSGTPVWVYSFCHKSGCPDGELPYAGLVQGTDGDFYGTTVYGGTHNDGTVFEITPSGTLKTLLSFDRTDGAWPYAGLVQATNGNFYGTTEVGGTGTACTGGCGTVFEITPSGTLKTLHSFDASDGKFPEADLVQGTDGKLYGTTRGINGLTHEYCEHQDQVCGTVFEISTDGGTLTTLYRFCLQGDCPDGSLPSAALVQDTDGSFYGATESGGTDNDGTVFSLSVGLGPFVETLPASGAVGAAVKILGTDLTGATKVTFNGTEATFSVDSSSEISTTVPADATTGTLKVIDPRGTLSSNVPFRVTP